MDKGRKGNFQSLKNSEGVIVFVLRRDDDQPQVFVFTGASGNYI